MRFGAVFPQTEIGADPIAVRDFAQAAEALGYDHLLVFDHVTGVNAERADWDGIYTHRHMFHEVLTLLAYLAGITSRIELATGIIILPQRQTVLVAKQAAEVDVLSRGRLRLGIGIGWNAFEDEALGENFHDRGHRSEEQIAVMRALWTQDIVNFDGEWHKTPIAESTRCRCNSRSRSGSAATPTPLCAAPPESATAGFRSLARTSAAARL
jgi:probable F420-dependent oxidoreductase